MAYATVRRKRLGIFCIGLNLGCGQQILERNQHGGRLVPVTASKSNLYHQISFFFFLVATSVVDRSGRHGVLEFLEDPGSYTHRRSARTQDVTGSLVWLLLLLPVGISLFFLSAQRGWSSRVVHIRCWAKHTQEPELCSIPIQRYFCRNTLIDWLHRPARTATELHKPAIGLFELFFFVRLDRTCRNSEYRVYHLGYRSLITLWPSDSRSSI